jgi:PiT family inorganic phosphate transporter
MASFAHGSNDAQKSMGIITLSLFSAHIIGTFEVHLWVKILCALAMAAGTAVGGWRIISTMGGKIFRIEPINGFAADFTSSTVIYTASLLGAPVSTTHVGLIIDNGCRRCQKAKGGALEYCPPDYYCLVRNHSFRSHCCRHILQTFASFLGRF